MTQNTTLIRPFAGGDTSEVVSLWQRCGLTVPVNDPKRDIALKMAHSPALFYVATIGDSVVGTAMAGYDGHRGWIYYLGVDPAFQRRGVGKQLMAHCEAALRAEGCPKINLQIRVGNESALAFYAALGYQPDAVSSVGKRL